MTRYYLQPNQTGWELVKQSNTSGEWLDVSTVGTYETFEDGIAQAETYSPLMYDESFDVPEEWRASDDELNQRIERDEQEAMNG